MLEEGPECTAAVRTPLLVEDAAMISPASVEDLHDLMQ
jgi:hypothetical protein